jgi:hypothetical protein
MTYYYHNNKTLLKQTKTQPFTMNVSYSRLWISLLQIDTF